MEFYQFHPTCLFHPQAKRFLITEAHARRGGRPPAPRRHAFMKEHDPRGDLAPRDVVARAIDFEMKQHRRRARAARHHRQEAARSCKERFPNIYAECLRWGIDITTAAHPGRARRRTSCAAASRRTSRGARPSRGSGPSASAPRTGLHGANRLASNSLLEGLVFGHRAAAALEGRRARASRGPTCPSGRSAAPTPSDEAVVITQNWDELRRLMWNYVGIVRSNKRLRARGAPHRAPAGGDRRVLLEVLRHARSPGAPQHRPRRAAHRRVRGEPRESRGLHFTIDYPGSDPKLARDTVTKRGVPAHGR